MNNNKQAIKSRMLLETCSSANFITEDLARSLNLPLKKCSVSVSSLNNQQSRTKFMLSIKFKSIYDEFQRQLIFYTVPVISKFIPDERFPREKMVIPHDIRLADPDFYQPRGIDL